MTITLLSLLALTALAAEPAAILRPLDGESLKGRLVALSAVRITLETAAGPQEFVTSKLMWVELHPSVAAKPTV